MAVSQSDNYCVLGAGTMGCQIAFSYAFAGKPVMLWARREAALIEAQQTMADTYDFLVSEELARAEDKENTLALIGYSDDLATSVNGASFIIEAIAEDMALKQELLQRVEALCPEQAILASTTSALCASDLQKALKRPEQFCVAHYIQPAHLMALVEVVAGQKTSKGTVEQLKSILAETGKTPVECPDIPGFLFARIQHVILREFADLQSKGLVSAEACDTIMRQGYAARLPAMGPFEHADLAGLDLLNSAGAKAVWADICNHTDPAQSSVGALNAQGHTGMKSGQGYYDWHKRDSKAFKQQRDKEIITRVKLNKGAKPTFSDE
ncbi:3-hydroxyacyl-CoA dehydrogenase family protein [Polycladidibacter stylochi]|uniref:3-hydroxyacyl-CoA dehydrogenase family protein n=1 Tax=Polycladidibacter stylochi TaxID=1807766 RepID=UPI00083507F7|nr:3-hydroxyacyl-CoA dehydrogenase family protein [Pseudovibrio stylochi]